MLTSPTLDVTPTETHSSPVGGSKGPARPSSGGSTEKNHSGGNQDSYHNSKVSAKKRKGRKEEAREGREECNTVLELANLVACLDKWK